MDAPVPLGAECGAAVPTGFPSVDSALGGGLRRGDLTVLGGEAGSGKSALVLAMAIRASIAGHASRFFTAEMSASRALERAVAMHAKVRVDDLRLETLDEPTRASVTGAAYRLVEHGPDIEALPAGGVPAIDEHLGRDEQPAAIVVVDPLESLAAGSRSLHEEIATVVLALKRVAVAHGVALVATSHISAHGPDRADRRPRLQDFGGLGAIAQHADVVLGLFREEMFDASRGVEGATELRVLKNRNGATGYVDLYFYKQWLRFEDVMDPE